jgi:ribose transport system ATP-binding protein
VTAGELRLEQRPVRFRSPAQAKRAGVAYVPEDRAARAAFLDLSVRENLSAADTGRYWRRLRFRRRDERADARRSMAEYGIKAASEAAPLTSLSGGNQQKVMLARWLRLDPRLLLLDEPTQGVDAAARIEIHALVRGAAQRGSAVLMVSSDFEELVYACDRVVVLAKGRTVAEVAGPDLVEERLTELAYALST